MPGAVRRLVLTLMSGTSHTEQLRWPDVGSTCLHRKSLPCRPFLTMSRSTIMLKSIFAVTYAAHAASEDHLSWQTNAYGRWTST